MGGNAKCQTDGSSCHTVLRLQLPCGHLPCEDQVDSMNCASIGRLQQRSRIGRRSSAHQPQHPG